MILFQASRQRLSEDLDLHRLQRRAHASRLYQVRKGSLRALCHSTPDPILAFELLLRDINPFEIKVSEYQNRNPAMINSVSASAATSLISSSSSSAASQLEAQIVAKKAELSHAKEQSEKDAIQSEIDALQEQLEALSKSGSSQKKSTDRMSGESDRIGSTNFNEATDFGSRVAYL